MARVGPSLTGPAYLLLRVVALKEIYRCVVWIVERLTIQTPERCWLLVSNRFLRRSVMCLVSINGVHLEAPKLTELSNGIYVSVSGCATVLS